MRNLAIAAIVAYKRHLSPRKGFGCAYRIHVGGASCSTFGLRAARRFGVWRGLAALRRRLVRCSQARRRATATRPRRPSAQAGFIDALDGCDAATDCCCWDALDLFDGDRRRARKKNGSEPRHVDIRPGRWR